MRLVLDGEDPAKLDREELVARIVERDRQLRRKFAPAPVWNLEAVDYRTAARAVFGGASSRP